MRSMKQILLYLLFPLCTGLFGQISISKFSLPYKGATLKTYVNISPEIDFSANGGPQTWDFSNLSKTNPNEVELLDPSEGSVDVSNATFIIKTTDFVEQYYKNTGEFIEETYIKTLDPIFNSFEISNSYAKNPMYRKGTIIFGQSYAYEGRIEAPFAWDDLPDTLTGGIGLQLDSIRFNTNWVRTDEITGWGTVILPDASWPALKEESNLERFVTIDVFFLGTWIEAPVSLLEAFLGDFADALQPDTSYSVNFYTDEAIEVLAAIQLSEQNGEANSIEYKQGSEITEIFNATALRKPEVSTYPNPSYGITSFKFDNCRAGTYNVQIHNILGYKIWSKEYQIKQNQKPIEEDLSMLTKGTYLYSVYDPLGKKIATKRLVIINP